MTDAQFMRQLARAPVGGAVCGTAARMVQNLRLQFRTLRLDLSALMTTIKSG